jgi:hypothetical protein
MTRQHDIVDCFQFGNYADVWVEPDAEERVHRFNASG